MSSNAIICVHYQKLKKIGEEFEEIADEIEKLHKKLNAKLSALEQGGWVGPSASKFSSDMRDQTLCNIERLKNALRQSNTVCIYTIKTMQRAEDDAADAINWMGIAGVMLGI